MLLPASMAFGPDLMQVKDWALPTQPLPRTALRIEKGQGKHWAAHLARLRNGAIFLGWDASWLGECFDQARVWVSGAEHAVCRLRVFPGALHARVDPPPSRRSPYRLRPMAHPLMDLRGQARAALKGLLGPWDQTVLEVASQVGAEDAMLIWPDGTLAETAISACGFLQEGSFRMPPPEGRVESITETLDLPDWARKRGWKLHQGPIFPEEIKLGQIWCMNAARGLWQAETIN